jgi:hypothetical protein
VEDGDVTRPVLRDELLDDDVCAVQVYVGAIFVVNFCHHSWTRDRAFDHFFTRERVTGWFDYFFDLLLGKRVRFFYVRGLVWSCTPREGQCENQSQGS